MERSSGLVRDDDGGVVAAFAGSRHCCPDQILMFECIVVDHDANRVDIVHDRVGVKVEGVEVGP